MDAIHVHIERLVLDGWPLGRREAEGLRVAVEAELGRLLGEGALGEGFAADRVAGGTVTWQPGGDVAGLGAQVAQSVQGGLGQ